MKREVWTIVCEVIYGSTKIVKGLALNTNLQNKVNKPTVKFRFAFYCAQIIFLCLFSSNALAAFPDPLVNTATATVPAGVTDPTSTGGVNTATDSNTLSLTAPTVAKAFSPASIAVGGTSTVTITLGNANTTAATLSAALTDSLPTNVLVAATPNIGGTCAAADVTAAAGSGTITYASGATIPATTGCTITVDVTSTVPTNGTPYENSIAAGDLQTDLGNNPADTEAELIVVDDPADLSLIKSVNNSAAVSGETLTFTITVNNAGPGDATNVEVVDQLPAGFTFVSSSPSQGSYDSGTGIWTIGTITTVTPATLEIIATVAPATGLANEYLNVAQVTASDQADPDSTPNLSLIHI